MGTYFQEVSNAEVAVANPVVTGSCIYPLLEKKIPEAWKKPQGSNSQNQYNFEVSKTKQIFDFLLKEDFIKLPPDHKIPSKEELKGKDYCKYHNSFNHSTNTCWVFRNVVQDRINKGTLKFPEKKDAMLIEENPFPPVAIVNSVNGWSEYIIALYYTSLTRVISNWIKLSIFLLPPLGWLIIP